MSNNSARIIELEKLIEDNLNDKYLDNWENRISLRSELAQLKSD